MAAYHGYVEILGVIGWRLLRPRTVEERHHPGPHQL
jgi:hypothetical protein